MQPSVIDSMGTLRHSGGVRTCRRDHDAPKDVTDKLLYITTIVALYIHRIYHSQTILENKNNAQHALL